MTRSDKNIDRSCQARGSDSAGSISVSVRSVQPVLMYLAARGWDLPSFLNGQRVDRSLLSDPDARLPHATAIGLWKAAGELTNDPDLGLHAAEMIRPGQFGTLDYALRTSANLGEAFTRLAAYHRVFHDAAEVRFEIEYDRGILSHHLPLPGGAPRLVSEFVLGAWLVTSRQATGIDLAPLAVCFPNAEPADTSEHFRVFRCTLKFGQNRSELILSREFLDLPLLKADPVLQDILNAQVVALLDQLPKALGTTDTVRRFVVEELSNGQPRLEQLARRLHMSLRTLHRKLEQEGTSFRFILAEVRRELAMRHVSERRLAIGEIAFLLGFSEVSAFHRAFKHWTGRAPSAFRAAQKISAQDP